MTIKVKIPKSCQFCIGGKVKLMDGELKCINCGRPVDYKPLGSKRSIEPTKDDYKMPRRTTGCRAATEFLGKQSYCLVNCPFSEICCYYDDPKRIWALVREKNGNGHKK